MTKNSDKHYKIDSKQVAEKVLADNKEKMIDSVWNPTYGWYIKTTGVVLIFLVIIFFVLNMWLKPYMREIPHEIAPWLDNR
jgi:hypothetical protein